MSYCPVEVSKYDQKIVLEALHNCIAHQDYSRNARVVVIEQPDRLVFENEGSFYDGEHADYLEGNRIPRRYRNPFLAQAMAELNMIDTMGYGIHDMYARQARRYFPMPDYDLSESGTVKLTIYGGVVDPAYSRMLIQENGPGVYRCASRLTGCKRNCRFTLKLPNVSSEQCPHRRPQTQFLCLGRSSGGDGKQGRIHSYPPPG